MVDRFEQDINNAKWHNGIDLIDSIL